jgi:predicted dienelactone hydrolase
MRPLEILLAILLGLYLLAPLFLRTPIIKYIPLLALVVSIVQIEAEGYRWQMIPIYLLTAICALLNLRTFFRTDPAPALPRRSRLTTSFLAVLLLIVVALATALPALLPVPRIAKPSGRFPVGTRTYVLTDASRKELYSGRDEPRKFMVQVWYPAAPGPDAVHAPWVQNADRFAPAISRFLKLPDFFLDHLTLSVSPAYQDMPLMQTVSPFPVIVFSHGWNGFDAQNTAQMVELASHGYFVMSMQHTYGAMVTIFPDGEVALNNPSALPEGSPEPGYTDAARKLVNQWVGDISYALDFLSDQNAASDSPFHSALDMTRIGVYGHSTGGGATIQFCGTDPRCKVGLTEDAFMTPVSQTVQDQGLTQPFLFLFSQAWRDDLGSKNNNLFDRFLPHVPEARGVATILGTAHYDFTDLPLLSPLAPQLGLKGPINGKRVVKIVNDYLLAYFDQELKGIPSLIPFGTSSDYPELRWEE